MRVRSKVTGTAARPRLSVTITNKHVSAQLIDDVSGKTLGSVSSVKQEIKGTMTDKAKWAGEQIAAEAKKHKIASVVFDRNGRIYHGRLHALAETARSKGLEF
ncbi:MAG TPA: 50S ribosomal protein L18 [Candidatus Nanoarchaeia archaeon]|nr:50S ribosomal protein L18 [Candidatus Nanoarchaeia archaeon]